MWWDHVFYHVVLSSSPPPLVVVDESQMPVVICADHLFLFIVVPIRYHVYLFALRYVYIACLLVMCFTPLIYI